MPAPGSFEPSPASRAGRPWCSPWRPAQSLPDRLSRRSRPYVSTPGSTATPCLAQTSPVPLRGSRRKVFSKFVPLSPFTGAFLPAPLSSAGCLHATPTSPGLRLCASHPRTLQPATCNLLPCTSTERVIWRIMLRLVCIGCPAGWLSSLVAPPLEACRAHGGGPCSLGSRFTLGSRAEAPAILARGSWWRPTSGAMGVGGRGGGGYGLGHRELGERAGSAHEVLVVLVHPNL